MIKKIITSILVWEARLALKRWKPKIVGITGSVGKSSAKEAIFAVLDGRFKARKGAKSYNSELGLSLAVLGLSTAWHSPLGWLKNAAYGFREIFRKGPPNVLVLEFGVDRAGDMERLLKIARPDAAVFTAIGEIPVHVEFFAGPEELVKEKSKILKNLPAGKAGLPAGGTAILNFDDETVWETREKTNAEVLSFGFSSGADIISTNYQISKDGVSFKLEYKGSTVPIRLKNVFGRQAVYASLAAAATGIVFGMNLIEISEALQKYQPPPGRLRLITGIKNSLVLDDSYNASPLATHAALDTLRELDGNLPDGKAGRKIFVFGDMLEIGKYTILAHKAVGDKAAAVADYLITVGPRAKFTAEGAVSAGMQKENVASFSTAREAAEHLKKNIQESDLVLVKGSQGMRMERVVEEIMAEPERAEELLARQDKYWKNKE